VVSDHGHTHIEAFPISIDYRGFAELSASEAVLQRVKQIKAKTHGIQIVVGVDRLDYTKGIPERIKAYGNFLRRYPEFHQKVELIQIVVPSREGIPRYDQLKREVERLVTHVNGEFSVPGWVPINFIYRSVPRDELIAIYRAADVALITSLKDGMNLVAKEYCAVKTEVNGVLVLSEFAGAAPELRIGAILVNPNDEVGVAAALKQALEMQPTERRRRMLRLRQQIREADILTWRDRFFHALEKTGAAESGARKSKADEPRLADSL
jgi:trehalose 6-phosphate synthase